LVMASVGRATQRLAAMSALAFGLLLIGAAAMPSFGWELTMMVGVGAASTVFLASTNSVLQLRADPAFRGRVMSLFAIAFLGTTPIGAPLLGWIGERFGPRMALGFGALASIAAALVALAFLRHREEVRRAREAAPLPPPPEVAEVPA